MPNDTVSEVVIRPAATPGATGAYTGVESIAQSGQTLTLDLSKQADLTTLAGAGAPPLSINLSEALSVLVTKTATSVSAQFSLTLTATVGVIQPDGSVNPFNTNLSIEGTVTFTPDAKSCHVDYRGHDCGANLACDGSDGLPHGTLSLDDAVTSYDFNNTAADGFANLIISQNAVTSAVSGSEAPDPQTADAGAHAIQQAIRALENAFPGAHDPVQGVDHADAGVLFAMEQAALAMIANPGVQTTAVDAVVAATVAGARLALIDGLAAYDVVAAAPAPVAVSAPGDILLA